MQRMRGLIIATTAAALAVGSFAAPAAAANPELAIVNGIPGRTVDVCVGNSEARSRLAFGRWFKLVVGPGSRTIRWRAAGPGNCQGQVLARTTIDLAIDDDYTLVGTARQPDKVVVFDNTPVPVGDLDNFVYLRNASDLGSLVISFETQEFGTPEPADAPAEFEKGDSDLRTFPSPEPLLVAAYRPDAIDPLVGPRQFLTLEGRRQELIVVGTTRRNARFVAVVRPTLPI